LEKRLTPGDSLFAVMTTHVKTWLPGAGALVAITLLSYVPAYRAGFVWDDPDYIVNNPTLRSPDGLALMWTDRHSLPQWYPLVHTTFWVEYQLWGAKPTGYHVVNVLLHACNALVLWRLLKRLSVPGAWLAGCLFAVHPVHVESVAWVTERKNVLSLLLYLLAMIAYLRAINLRSDEPPRDRPFLSWYAASLGLFLGALFSKTVTCSLPAALLLVIWWKTGRVRARDVAWLVPFFAIGIYLALGTAQLERVRVGAHGHEWQYGDTPMGDFLARTIIAGRALWFYAGKLLWPASLAFVYERWTISWRDPLQYAYPLAALTLIVALFLLRRRIGRGPAVAVLFFVGTLFPALGFFNVFPHRYAFVADHFQYHASIGLIAVAAALVARGILRVAFPIRALIVVLLIVPPAVLTYAQAQVYESPITLWDDAVRKSPNNWMAWTNYGNALVAAKLTEEALPKYEEALRLAPDVDDVQYNAGHLRARQGRFRDAEQHFLRAVQIKPTYVPAWESLGDLYADELNEPQKAIDAYLRAYEIAPWRPGPRQKMDALLRRLGARH
jgi:tetratricopeptide (TPR) repeat protein